MDEKRVPLPATMSSNDVDKILKPFVDQGYFFAGLEEFTDQPGVITYILRLPGRKD